MAAVVPKRIVVGPFTFTVVVGGPRWLRHLADHHALQDEGQVADRLYGRTDLDAGSIGINPRQSADMKRETLLHEVLHACFFAGGGSPDSPDATEESVVLALSPVLLEVLRNNPHLVDYLLRR